MPNLCIEVMGFIFCTNSPKKIFTFELCYYGKVPSPLQSSVPRNQGIVPIFFFFLIPFGSLFCADVIVVQAEEKIQTLFILKLVSPPWGGRSEHSE